MKEDKLQRIQKILKEAKDKRESLESQQNLVHHISLFLAKLIVFFIKSTVIFFGYNILSTKLSLIDFSYWEFLIVFFSICTLTTYLRNIFK